MSKTYRVTLPSGVTVSRSSVRDYTHAIAYRAGRSAKDVREALQGRLREIDQDPEPTPAARTARAEVVARLEDLDGVEGPIPDGPWIFSGFRSSEALAQREARRLERVSPAYEIRILDVELVHDDDAPVTQAVTVGVVEDLVAEFGGIEKVQEIASRPVRIEVDEDQHIAQVGLAQGRFVPVPLEEEADEWAVHPTDESDSFPECQDTTGVDAAAAIEAALDLAVDAYLNGRTVSDRAREDLRESLRPAIVAASPGLLSTGWERGYEDGTVDEIRRPMIDAGVRSATVDPYLKGAQA